MSEQRYYFGIPFEVRTSKMEEPKFKVGDRVTVLINAWAPDAPKGSTGVIANVREDGCVNVKIDCGDDFAWFFEPDDIELADKPPFAAGDRVKLKRHHYAYACGDTGTVYCLDGEFTGVTMDPYGVRTHLHTDSLELAADCAERKEQPKFKAGDWARCLKSCDEQFTKGKIYEIREVPSEDWLTFILDDRGSKTNGWAAKFFEQAAGTSDNLQQRVADGRTSINAARVELRLPIIQPAIVARVLDGQPRPSNIPYVHSDSGAALQEAERLAKNNPGQEFAVYQRVGARVASVEYKMKEVA